MDAGRRWNVAAFRVRGWSGRDAPPPGHGLAWIGQVAIEDPRGARPRLAGAAAALRHGLQHPGGAEAGCNGHRPVEQRLARWMLMAHHRSEGDEFPMTREFLSLMLGVRRAGVTVVAGALQKAGLLRYGNGRMAITDRPGLEAAACDCYGPVRRDFERLLGPVAGS